MNSSRKFNRLDSLENKVVCFHRVGAGKWRTSGEELKHEDAQRPEVSGKVMAFVEDDFGRDVLGCAAECPRFAAGTDLLGETEVDL